MQQKQSSRLIREREGGERVTFQNKFSGIEFLEKKIWRVHVVVSISLCFREQGIPVRIDSSSFDVGGVEGFRVLKADQNPPPDQTFFTIAVSGIVFALSE